MTTNDEIRDYVDELYIPEILPRDRLFRVMAARPCDPTEPVTEPIAGIYHAKYMLHQIETKHGYAGVSFHIETVRECDDCGHRGTDFQKRGRFTRYCPECDSSNSHEVTQSE